MKKEFGTFENFNCEFYEATTIITPEKPNIDGRYKIYIEDGMLWIMAKTAGGWEPSITATSFTIKREDI